MKSIILHVRVTPDHHTAWKRQAKAAGQDLCAWIRDQCDQRVTVPTTRPQVGCDAPQMELADSDHSDMLDYIAE